MAGDQGGVFGGETGHWALVLEFPDQSPSFCDGFESGQIWAKFSLSAEPFARWVHRANVDLIQRMAARKKWAVTFSEHVIQGQPEAEWVWLDARPSEHPRAALRVVAETEASDRPATDAAMPAAAALGDASPSPDDPASPHGVVDLGLRDSVNHRLLLQGVLNDDRVEAVIVAACIDGKWHTGWGGDLRWANLALGAMKIHKDVVDRIDD